MIDVPTSILCLSEISARVSSGRNPDRRAPGTLLEAGRQAARDLDAKPRRVSCAPAWRRNLDASQPAFYHVRAIEIPTPRWTAYDALRFGVKMSEGVPMDHQERAWTSPIWYSPLE
ncbi:MAG: DUF3604 domain-containing protein [Deltaproteobacteria bacterium]|nr:DUF3604 domain-containing protein [Deltaproteobacteria bacterium]